MSNQEKIAIVSGVIMFLGNIVYAYKFRQNPKTSNLFSWIIWGANEALMFLNMSLGEAEYAYNIGACMLGSVLVICFLLRYRKWELTRLNAICIILSVIGMGMWLIASQSIWGMIFFLAVTWIAGIPMFVELIKNPRAEEYEPWMIFWLAGLLGVLGIPALTLADAMQPIAFFIFQNLTVLLISRRWWRWRAGRFI